MHEHRHDKEKSITKAQVIEFDADYFAHREVAVFDDIITTGATLDEAGRTLLKAGAEEVFAAALAQPVEEHH